MAITVNGNSNILVYEVTEDAVSLNPNDTSAGFGQLTYTGPEKERSDRLLGDIVTLNDPLKGSFSGIYSSLSGTDGLLAATVNSYLSKLSVWLTIPPFSGTLQGYLNHVSALVGLVPPIQADGDIASRPVVAPGYVGNVWGGTKAFLSANSLDISQVSGAVRVSAMRSHTTEFKGDITATWDIQSGESAEILTTKWYEARPWRTQAEVYPIESSDVISVDANETIEQEVTINGSLTQVNQPQVIDYVSANTDSTGTNGVYCVAGNDGKPILASRWLASGGSLRVELTNDPSIIKIIVHGGSVEEYSPYRIAATAGSSNFYNSLHITGTGIAWTPKEFTMRTGAPRATDSEETKLELDNRNLVSESLAYTAALRTALVARGGRRSLTGTAREVQGGQQFGRPLGGRIIKEDAVYRIESLSHSPSSVQFDLGLDTTMADFGSTMEGKTIQQFNALHAGDSLSEFSNHPLKV